MSYSPIDYRAYKELEAIGLKVPFDPKSPESNVYVYQSTEDNTSLGKLKSICDGLHIATFGDSSSVAMVVNEYEVNKHLERCIAVNLPSVGDNVRYSEYKKLVFSVIDIQDNIATVSHSLRNVDLVLDIPLNNLSIVEDEESIVQYTSTIFSDLSQAIYIDSDSIDEDTDKQFALIVRLKTMYKGYEVIFLNPDEDLQNLLTVLKISSVYGNVNNIVANMGYQDLIYTHNLEYLEYIPNILVKEQGKYYSYINEITIDNLGFKDIKSLKLYNAIKKLYIAKVIDQDINFKSLKNKINQSYDFAKNLYISYKKDIEVLLDTTMCVDGDLQINQQSGALDIKELQSEFEKLKLHYYIDNIEYYIYILKS